MKHLLLVILLLPAAARAQGYAEGIALSYEVLPLHFTATPAETFRADVYRASIIVPLALSADSAHSLLLGAGLETLRFNGSGPGFPVSNVYGLAPVLGYRARLTPLTELTVLALPALNSDLRNVRGEDITYGGVVRGSQRLGPRLALRATLGYRQQFYGPQYIVLLGLDWQVGEKWRVFGDLPTTFTVSYALGPRFNAGFNLMGLNSSYRLQSENQYLQYQQAHYGLFAEGYLSAHWALRATAAYAGTRKINAYARDEQWPATIDYIGLGTAPTPLSPEVAKGLAFRLALSYRVPMR